MTLSPAKPLKNLSIDFTTPTTRTYVSPADASRRAEEGEEGVRRVEAWCYTWKDTSDGGLRALEDKVWEYVPKDLFTQSPY
jgi:hypothetical protein